MRSSSAVWEAGVLVRVLGHPRLWSAQNPWERGTWGRSGRGRGSLRAPLEGRKEPRGPHSTLQRRGRSVLVVGIPRQFLKAPEAESVQEVLGRAVLQGGPSTSARPVTRTRPRSTRVRRIGPARTPRTASTSAFVTGWRYATMARVLRAAPLMRSGRSGRSAGRPRPRTRGSSGGSSRPCSPDLEGKSHLLEALAERLDGGADARRVRAQQGAQATVGEGPGEAKRRAAASRTSLVVALVLPGARAAGLGSLLRIPIGGARQPRPASPPAGSSTPSAKGASAAGSASSAGVRAPRSWVQDPARTPSDRPHHRDPLAPSPDAGRPGPARR